MRPIWTATEARGFDAHARDVLGLPSIVLMENAGRGAFELACGLGGDALRRVVVVGGPGQNGGDAWVVARLLFQRGVDVRCLLVAEGGRRPSGDAAVMLATLERLGVPVVLAEDPAAIAEEVVAATLVVDGLFGTGLARDLDGLALGAVRAICGATCEVLALDLPSGLDADDGRIRGAAVRATMTATFGARKLGLLLGAGPSLAGRVQVVPLGLPAFAESAAVRALDPEDAATAFGRRPFDVHKRKAGRVLVFAGSPGTMGAALLAAHGAHRAGAGLVTLACRPEHRAEVDGRVLETMTATYTSADEAVALANDFDAVVVGPGFGLDEDARAVGLALALRVHPPVVLDADALTIVSGSGVAELRGARGARYLTPHEGEAARLLAMQSAEVRADRVGSVRAMTERSGQVCLLKGPNTLVAEAGGPMLLVPRGTPALATGGSGDVLSGVVAGVLASGATRGAVALAAAAYAHAAAGELAARADRGLLAHEIADALPEAISRGFAPN